jgi:hypothetical protein
MLVALQLVAVATVPLNMTVLVPCVVPKFVPAIVTGVPTEPVVTERLVMSGPEGGGLDGLEFCVVAQLSIPSVTRHKTPICNGIRIRAGPTLDKGAAI